MSNQAQVSKIDYEMLEQQRAEALQRHLKEQMRSRFIGGMDSLSQAVLKRVVEAEYDNAGLVIDTYVDLKGYYPDLKPRVEPHIRHAKELINAIRTKRNLPGLTQLAMSKQKEILDHAIHHYEELKHTLRVIERSVRDEAVRDIRSTVWILRTGVYVVIAVVAAAFIADYSGAMGDSLWRVFNDVVDTAWNAIVKAIPFL